MSRELRVRPPARSSTAARVRVASEKPKAARRRATASADMTGARLAAVAPVGRRRGRRLDGGEGFEQGTEEEPLVDGPHVALATAQGVVEPGRGRSRGIVSVIPAPGPDGAGRTASVGHRVGLLLLDELQPVLHGAQEPVRVGQHGGVLGGHVAGAGQLGEGAQGRAVPDPRVVAAVHELEELHREFDVADPARAALDLAPDEAATGHDSLGPGLHRPHRGQLVGAVVPSPHLLDGGALEPTTRARRHRPRRAPSAGLGTPTSPPIAPSRRGSCRGTA